MHFQNNQYKIANSHIQYLLGYSSPPEDQSPDEVLEEESVDCQVIDLLKEEVLSHSSSIPKEFILKVVVLLNKGSILSTPPLSFVGQCHSIVRLSRLMNGRRSGRYGRDSCHHFSFSVCQSPRVYKVCCLVKYTGLFKNQTMV